MDESANTLAEASGKTTPGASSTAAVEPSAPTFPEASIPEILRTRAERQPHTTAFVELGDGETVSRSWDYTTLARRSAAVARALRAQCGPGERALILHDPGLDYVATFFGSLQAGITAVTCVPPQGRRAVKRLFAIVDDARPSLVLTSERIQATEFRLRGDHWHETGLEWLTTDQLAEPAHHDEIPMEIHDPALLQYTSGSTGRPKGVVIHHENLLANCRAALDWLGYDPQRRGLSWLPPFHDMGLMGGIVQPLYEGFPVFLMTPGHFIQAPGRWLRAIHEHRITATGAPNFAYDLCVDQITDEELKGLDLSCLNVAFCGAEPISVRTLKRFAQRFAPCGFDPEAFNPCYGMAEATLLVSGKPGDQAPVYRRFDSEALQQGRAERALGDESDRTLISCGQVVPELEVAIVEPDEHRRCPDGVIGEIWVAGPSIGYGYWQKPKENDVTFCARLTDSERNWMRTGDLGFVHEDELFVTGRLKDLIIVAGNNHYPQDIEDCIRPLHPAIHPTGIAATGVPVGEGEGVAVMVELRRGVGRADEGQLRADIMAAVAREHGIRLEDVVFGRVGSVPRTTSGKVQRGACRELLLERRTGRRPATDKGY